MNERLVITVIAIALAAEITIHWIYQRAVYRLSLGFSTIFLTGVLLFYYHLKVIDPSHGIGIIILPLTTGWLVWRRDTTGKPALSTKMIVCLQIIFCLLYFITVQLQEA